MIKLLNKMGLFIEWEYYTGDTTSYDHWGRMGSFSEKGYRYCRQLNQWEVRCRFKSPVEIKSEYTEWLPLTDKPKMFRYENYSWRVKEQA